MAKYETKPLQFEAFKITSVTPIDGDIFELTLDSGEKAGTGADVPPEPQVGDYWILSGSGGYVMPKAEFESKCVRVPD